jgi:(Z)-2-((N-methylformamido)methylene)-5-hydroxybutyrolactone dehydrogenase
MSTLAVIRFDTEDDAVAMANDSRHGLVGGLFTADVGRAHRVAARLENGLVSVNTFRPIHPSLPYGGFKLSGLGRENGLAVLDEYTETKSVVVDLSTAEPADPFAD